MDQPIKQPQKQAEPATAIPQIKLKTRLKPLEEAERLAKYMDTLEPIAFSYFDDNPYNPNSLPEKVGAVLCREKLVSPAGIAIEKNRHKLNDPDFFQELNNKMLFCLIEESIRASIFQSLIRALKEITLFNHSLERCWRTLANFMAEYYAPQAAVTFCAERYPDRLTRTKIISRLPLFVVNNLVKKAMGETVAKDKQKIRKTVEGFLSPFPWLKPKIRSSLVNSASLICTESMPNSCIILSDFKININANDLPFFEIEYTPEI